MPEFRRLVTAALLAGTLAGGLLAALQIVTMGPLIVEAEGYERAAAAAEPASDHHAAAEWEPADGLERTGYTVLGTILTAIAYAAMALAVASLLGIELNLRRGVLLGLAGCACFTLAPALGLPPKPPGVAGAELHAAQIWWAGTAAATAVGAILLARGPAGWPWRVLGVAAILAPHVIGAPPPLEPPLVPAELITRFAVYSVATQTVFWLLLGAIGGAIAGRLAVRGT